MDKITELIEKLLPLPVALPIVLHIAILFGIWHIPNLEDSLRSYLQLKYSAVPVITIFLSVSSLYLLMLASYIVLCFKFSNKFTPKFGVLWDKNKEPYCPSCKTYLSGYTENPPTGYYFWCHTHKDYVFIHNNGIPTPLTEVQKLL